MQESIGHCSQYVAVVYIAKYKHTTSVTACELLYRPLMANLALWY